MSEQRYVSFCVTVCTVDKTDEEIAEEIINSRPDIYRVKILGEKKVNGIVCIFCGADENITNHHILPNSIRKKMGWTGKKGKPLVYTFHKVPLCEKCHVKLNIILSPLYFIIKFIMEKPSIPVELLFIIEKATNDLLIINEESKDD